jgi:hypothetical protein
MWMKDCWNVKISKHASPAGYPLVESVSPSWMGVYLAHVPRSIWTFRRAWRRYCTAYGNAKSSAKFSRNNLGTGNRLGEMNIARYGFKYETVGGSLQ